MNFLTRFLTHYCVTCHDLYGSQAASCRQCRADLANLSAEVVMSNPPPVIADSAIILYQLYQVETYAEVQIRCQVPSECPICLESYQEQDEVLLTECQHLFHRECVETLARCPLCRAEF